MPCSGGETPADCTWRTPGHWLLAALGWRMAPVGEWAEGRSRGIPSSLSLLRPVSLAGVTSSLGSIRFSVTLCLPGFWSYLAPISHKVAALLKQNTPSHSTLALFNVPAAALFFLPQRLSMQPSSRKAGVTDVINTLQNCVLISVLLPGNCDLSMLGFSVLSEQQECWST